MRTKLLALVAFCSCLTIAVDALSADSEPGSMRCTPEKIFSCEADKDRCVKIPVVNIDGAYLLNIDLKNKVLKSFAGSKELSGSAIDRIEHHHDLLFLHGYQDERRGEFLPHSWSVIINLKTGQLTITSVENGVGYTLAGNCVVNTGDQP